jgi:hypothetical protein
MKSSRAEPQLRLVLHRYSLCPLQLPETATAAAVKVEPPAGGTT